ncbi:hypothetical protein SAMN04489832_0499 [Micromonospora cremea]|uniref:Uncharacterized protein n=1 Tax=Micromonospora cremea TaxID=709881 RepID=A0A1N5U109_9ACTN|nr:hypothetical protein SAMN04489832_0499 [Micromonospora cremea]
MTLGAAAEALEYSRRRIWRIERASRNQRPVRWSGVTYRSTAHTSLLPWQVRERRFKLVGLGRRGLDPSEVYARL